MRWPTPVVYWCEGKGCILRVFLLCFVQLYPPLKMLCRNGWCLCTEIYFSICFLSWINLNNLYSPQADHLAFSANLESNACNGFLWQFYLLSHISRYVGKEETSWDWAVPSSAQADLKLILLPISPTNWVGVGLSWTELRKNHNVIVLMTYSLDGENCIINTPYSHPLMGGGCRGKMHI